MSHQRKKQNVRARPKARATPQRKKAPKPATIRGRGGYTSALTGLGMGIGAAVGGPTGAAIGGPLGNLLGTIIGRGDYRVRKNTLAMGDHGPPTFAGDGSIVISHREFIADIIGTTGFSVRSWRLNPGVYETFPWLSRIAQNFQTYEFLGLVFEYKATSAVAVSASNTALGTVTMATNYDADAMPFYSKQSMEAYQYSQSCSPAMCALHPVECAPSNSPLRMLYIQTPMLTSSDARFADLGEFNLATVGMQTSNVIGELWVSYHVRLTKPSLPCFLGCLNDMFHVYATATDPALPFAGAVNQQYGACEAYVPSSSASTIVFPQAGYYGVVCRFENNGGANFTAVPTITLGANIGFQGSDVWGSPDGTAYVAATNNLASVVSAMLYVTADGVAAANTVTFTGPVSATNYITDVFVHPMPPVFAARSAATAPQDIVEVRSVPQLRRLTLAAAPKHLADEAKGAPCTDLSHPVHGVTGESPEYVQVSNATIVPVSSTGSVRMVRLASVPGGTRL